MRVGPLAVSDLLDRVRKLLALASSPNVHEAAAAAARAQALITRHRLEGWLAAEASVDADPDPILDARDAPLEVAGRIRPWKSALAAVLAEANGCLCYTLDRGGDAAIVLVGRGRDRDAVAALWAWLVPRIEWLSATAGPGRSRAWHEAFRVGAADAIASRLAAAAGAEAAALDPAALVRVDPAARAHADALARFAAAHLRLGRGRALRVDARAWSAGRTAAESLALPADPPAAGPSRSRRESGA